MALVLAVMPAAPAYAATTVTFADSHLESAVRVALSMPAGGITDADMATLTSLDATSQGIRDLDGLQYATNLTSLDLSHNRIADLKPLSGLANLTRLDLSGNMITTVTVLGALRLGTADLGHNWLDVSADSAAKAVIDGWLGKGASVTYLPQGRATTCVVSTTSKTIGYAAKTAITGTLSDSGTAERVGGCGMTLQSSGDGTAFKNVTTSYSTTPGGTFAFTVAPTTKTYYRVMFAGSGCYYLSSTSRTVC